MNPRFSLIIPVLHESARINRTVGHLLRQADASGLPAEVVVVDGDPDGKTLAAIGNKSILTATETAGRGRQMNRGAALAHGDILVFLHADTRLPDDGLLLIDAACGHPARGAGAFDLAIDSAKPVYRLIEKTASLRSRLTGIPYGDQAFFFAADYFRSLGGFAGIPLMEDVEIMRRIKKRGDGIVIIGRPVRTSARRWEKEGVLKCTLRNWCLISLYLAGVSPERLAEFYQ
jgi:rSAM/selenodomain-associated transferase 2